MELWYRQPAREWVEALPLGNGHIGAMVYGGTERELIALNHDTLWSGYPRDTNEHGAADYLDRARELAARGEYLAAQDWIERHMLGQFTESYLPLGDLALTFPGNEPAENYRRGLDLSSAVASVSYSRGGTDYRREMFVSEPDQCLAVKLTATGARRLDFTVSFSCPLRAEVSAREGTLTVRGVAPSHVEPSYNKDMTDPIRYEEEDRKKGMRFTVLLNVEAPEGRVFPDGETLRVEGASCAVLRVCVRTSFNGFDRQPFTQGLDCDALAGEELHAALGLNWDGLLARHLGDYHRLWDRVDFSLAGGEEELPTDERLARFQQTQDDPRLYELSFHYGRYLLIACSRRGTQAANLQGIWNREMHAPWSSNYTININTQMNYWPAESCNLSELHEPLLDLIQELRATGAETAKIHYRARGVVTHHNTDLWRLSNPVGAHREGSAGYAYWFASFGWLCRHLFEHYEYTGDEAFLRARAYPALRDAALFYLDMLTENEAGELWITPDTSPENAFLSGGKVSKIAKSASMTMSVVREVFEHVILCCDLLGEDKALRAELAKKLPRLAPCRIGSQGQLLEWDEEFDEPEPHHRHISHLYPLYPGEAFCPDTTPEWAAACKKSLERRGDAGTGWSLGWKINAWARLWDGDHALRLLKRQLRLVTPGETAGGGGTYPNLFDAHPPFQIDGNFAATSGIAQMLLQSGGGRILLLPALPGEWPEGRARGLCAKPGVQVDLHFAGGALREASLTARRPCDVLLCYRGAQRRVSLSPGEPLRVGPDFFGG